MVDVRVVFAGTPGFARASLAALVDSGVVPVAVYTQPDRPAGRGRKLTASPVKQFAEEREIPVLQPDSLKAPAEIERLRDLRPDLMVVAAYGLLLPQAALDIPRAGCVNVHASLLPRWRGAAPIQAAILAGDEESGVCLMRMEAGLDTGPVYGCEAVKIPPAMTAGELHDELAAAGGRLLAARLPAIASGELDALPQDDSRATYAPKLRKEDAILDWRQPASAVLRAIRAYNPVPGANFGYAGERIKCWRAAAGQGPGDVPGLVLAAGPDGIEVACGDGSIRMLELQRPGRKRVDAATFARQYSLAGEQLG